MTQLFLFDTGTSNESLDPGTVALATFTQDNVSGFPAYASESADKLYKDSFPQEILATEPIKAGQLLNIFYSDSVKARLASATSLNTFANSVALTSASIGQTVLCAVKTAILPSTLNGAIWLSDIPGELSDTLDFNREIIQKVGEADGGIFYFYFHTPAITRPFNYSYLTRSN